MNCDAKVNKNHEKVEYKNKQFHQLLFILFHSDDLNGIFFKVFQKTSIFAKDSTLNLRLNYAYTLFLTDGIPVALGASGR
jgi:hypothetical protein